VSPPAYHLRINKAADRFALIEAIRRLPRLGCELEEYTYYGMGGPYLEDIRLLYEFFPEIPAVSIEINDEVRKRQEFHRPRAPGSLRLETAEIGDFIRLYEPKDKKSIFWLDYTDLDYSCFTDFKMLLDKVVPGSMIKITLRAHSRDYWIISEKTGYTSKKNYEINRFLRKFDEFLPASLTVLPWKSGEFAQLVQQMLQVASQQALAPLSTDQAFYPISSFYYSDGTWILTQTGVVWSREDKESIEKAFGNWEFSNQTWNNPRLIDIPNLSTQERLQLQRSLPCTDSPGSVLHSALGYLIGEDESNTKAALAQYAAFHRYFPYLLRGTP
jgi:hypothetical protein